MCAAEIFLLPQSIQHRQGLNLTIVSEEYQSNLHRSWHCHTGTYKEAWILLLLLFGQNMSTVLSGMNISPTYSPRISSTNTEIVWFLPRGTGGSLTFILCVNCRLCLCTISEENPHTEACLSQMFLEISVYLQKQYLWMHHGLVSSVVNRMI